MISLPSEAAQARRQPVLVGIDPALTNTGIVINTGRERIAVTVKSAAIPRGDRNPHGHSSRIERTAAQIVEKVPLGALVAIEGPSYMSKYGSPDERAGLRWSIIARLRVMGCRIVVITPKGGKAWLAENGNAGKDLMQARAAIVAPGLAAGEHEADAFALLSMLEYWAGVSDYEPGPKGVEAHGKVQWDHLIEGKKS
ncbi:hypothetical protein [Pseudomonas sp.]|uniref:hypothetical protein n=1 Tax=Pseudomonas sp. TaxID=306 RepID=UPI0026299154|nr:hypothetical protein [Pseudomonas sp.]